MSVVVSHAVRANRHTIVLLIKVLYKTSEITRIAGLSRTMVTQALMLATELPNSCLGNLSDASAAVQMPRQCFTIVWMHHEALSGDANLQVANAI